jgi:hypothetical protein
MSAVKKSRLFERAILLKEHTLLASSLILGLHLKFHPPRRIDFFVTFLHQGKKVKALYFEGIKKPNLFS